MHSMHDEEATRFRPVYRELTPDEKALVDSIKEKAVELTVLYRRIHDDRPGRYKSLAITALEESVMWAVKEATGPVPNTDAFAAPRRGV